MKSTILFAAAALACGAVLAQAPAGVVKNPSQEQAPTASGGKAQATAAAKAPATAGMAGATSTMGGSAMDMNGDGMISRKEWDAYHGKTWSGMKANKQGMVPWAEVEARMKGGPN